MKVGIIGCGGIAHVHAAVLKELPGITVVGCADIRPERAGEIAELLGTRSYSSMEELLDAEHPDAVHLCTPHDLHAPMTEAAAARGIAVFTEKPPVISRAQWASMLECAKRVPIGVCFQNRYNPNVVRARKILAEGTYGKLLGARAFVTWNRGEAYYSDDWHGKKVREGGGVLINQAIHTLDLMLGFLGHPDTVGSTLANHHLRGVIDVEDTAEICVTSGSRRGILYASNAYTADAPVLLELHTEKAFLRLEEDRLTVCSEGRVFSESFDSDARLGKAYWGAGHKRCITDFYRCLRTGEPFPNDLLSCTDTVETLLKIYDPEA